MPMQVHIEAQVMQVNLTGDLSYGVSWFLEKGMTDNGIGPFPSPQEGGPSKWSTLGATLLGGGSGGLAWTLVKNDAAAVINALDQVTDVKMLSTPSVFVRNNSEATFNVGTKIPIQSTSFNPTGSTGTISNVQYIDTGTILKVRPRVTKDGLVFLDVVQEISSADDVPANCNPSTTNCNPRIGTRRLKTTAAVQNGSTVLMAGLIDDSSSRGASGLPGLSRIPIIGGLFGRQNSGSRRSETIIFITPTIVRDAGEAENLTDEYGRRFRAMEPLQPKRKK
jgi:general secretion pathway protein D